MEKICDQLCERLLNCFFLISNSTIDHRTSERTINEAEVVNNNHFRNFYEKFFADKDEREKNPLQFDGQTLILILLCFLKCTKLAQIACVCSRIKFEQIYISTAKLDEHQICYIFAIAKN